MSLSVTIDGVEYASDHVRLRGGGAQGVEGLSSAADGTMAQGAIILDDPEGNIELRTWMPVIVEESACSQPRLFTGYIASFVEKRGRYTQGPGREIDITLNDQNVLLSLRIGTDGTTDRPAETDTERLAWLIDSAILDGIVFDTGFITGADRHFDAANLHGKTASEILIELAGPRGQIFFAFWDPTEDKVGLFYDQPTAVTFTSILSFSNVPGEYDATLTDTEATVYAPRLDEERTVTGEDVYGNIRYQYKGGVYYAPNPTTQSTYFPSPLLTRGINIENDTVGSPTTAKTFGDRLLQGPYASERSTIAFSSIVPAFQVGHILAGQRVQLHFSHITGFQDDFVFTRVETLTVAPIEGNPAFYEVYLTCSMTGLQTGGGLGPGGGDTTPFPQQPPLAPTELCVTYPGYPSGAVNSTDTIVVYNGDEYSVLWTVEQASDDGGSGVAVALQHATDSWGDHDFGHPTGNPSATETFTISGLSPDIGSAAHVHLNVSVDIGKSAAGLFGCGTFTLLTPGPNNPNAATGALETAPSGTPIEDETPTPDPDGANDTFTTIQPFAASSLHVALNGVELENGVDFTESSDGSGDFTFDEPPDADDQIVVWYIAG